MKMMRTKMSKWVYRVEQHFNNDSWKIIENDYVIAICPSKVLAEKIKTSPQTASYERTLKLNLG